MNGILLVLAWVVMALVALTLAALVIYGIRNVIRGRHHSHSVVMLMAPLLLALVLGLVTGSAVRAGILTALVWVGLAFAALVYSGIRSTLEV